jgi:osmotically-inducible protein OsmY
MITRIAILLGITIAAMGCDDKGSGARAPDNTEVNQRDRKADALTPGDQGDSEVDLTITRTIRQGVMKDDLLSMTAKNVKIITVGSVVTLRGPVKSEKERENILAIARGTDGVKRVDNQLEIAAN